MHETLLQQLEFKQADQYNLPRVKQFYKKNGMRAQAPKGDLVFIATEGTTILAALRLSPLNNCYLLRSMCVSASHRNQGIGSALLHHLQTQLNSLSCYCFPFSHLQSFYTAAGFILCDAPSAPEPVTDRYQRYLNNGKDICLMKHNPGSC